MAEFTPTPASTLCDMPGCQHCGIWTVTIVAMPDAHPVRHGVALSCNDHRRVCLAYMLDLLALDTRLTIEATP